jgi:hypothetical protein
VSASVEGELVHEQPTDDDASALAYLVRRRCPNTYLFFYGHALEDRVVRMTFIAKPTYSSRRKYLNDLLVSSKGCLDNTLFMDYIIFLDINTVFLIL